MPPGRAAPTAAHAAENATACFMCGADVRSRPRQRRRIPWSDIFLFTVVIGLALLWWTRGDRLPTLSAQVAAQHTPGAAAPTPCPARRAAPAQTVQPTATAPPTATPTPTVTPEFIAYTLKSGDTLLGVANAYGIPLDAILKANGLTGRELLKAGQTLRLPTTGMRPEQLTGNVTPAATATPDDSTLIYRVQKGDTLSALATLQGRSGHDSGRQQPRRRRHPRGRSGHHYPRGAPTPTATPTAPVTPTPTPGFPYPRPICWGRPTARCWRPTPPSSCAGRPWGL
ncbi:MAG: LysM peptidoglycan-binding domain-containing protein [Anaerolineae bacterium]|nr:MAG: LysM peptidoglycan-binding domain-containing protein [Anaerolineae bacterium]